MHIHCTFRDSFASRDDVIVFSRLVALPLRQARDAVRDQAAARRGARADGGRPPSPRPDARRRQLPRRRPARDPRGRPRRRDRLQPDPALGDERRRAELAERERAEEAVLAEYLPQPITDDELTALVAAAITETGAEGPRQMGQVMKVVQPQVGSRADGKRISSEVKRQLTGS